MNNKPSFALSLATHHPRRCYLKESNTDFNLSHPQRNHPIQLIQMASIIHFMIMSVQQLFIHLINHISEKKMQ